MQSCIRESYMFDLFVRSSSQWELQSLFNTTHFSDQTIAIVGLYMKLINNILLLRIFRIF